MKKVLFVFCLLSNVISSLFAQEEKSISPFLFEEYKEATIFMGGRKLVGKLNLYLPTGEFLYIDETDNNKEKILAKPEDVNLIRFGSRVFIPSDKGAVEVLSSEPLFYVQYKASIRDKGDVVGYGGTSSLSNVKSYSVNSTGTAYVSNPMTLEVGSIYNIYMIGKKQKEIKNMKQLLKHYSKHKDVLEKYIDENDIKFDNALQMLQLVKYADSLGK